LQAVKTPPKGGTVESKWGPEIPYAFQHDVFFVPNIFGNEAKFYRLKNQKVSIDTLSIKPHAKKNPSSQLNSNSFYTVQNDNSLSFNTTQENINRRKIIDKNVHDISEIEIISYIKYFGICYQYYQYFLRLLLHHKKRILLFTKTILSRIGVFIWVTVG
jgi:hypothetical protein